ncbi:MAG: hypothetical protein HY784_16440 [Chloroflexi bacterium]|nr:hypothetical protein [Chloroflexota bacterium]
MHNRMVDLYPLAERAYVRLEAEDLLSRCLKEDDPQPLRDLIDEVLAEERPDLDLLRGLLADLRARRVVLRERLFDTRRQVVTAFQDAWDINLAEFAPPQSLDQFHRLSPEALFAWIERAGHRLADEDRLLLYDVFSEAVGLAGELTVDLRLLDALGRYLGDWIAGLAVLAARTAPVASPYH